MGIIYFTNIYIAFIMISCGIIFLGKIIVNSVIESLEKAASIEF